MFRYLYDYTYECDSQEAVVFNYFYFALELYILISIMSILYCLAYGLDSFVSPSAQIFRMFGTSVLFAPAIIPMFLNGILSVAIVARKKMIERLTGLELILAVVIILISCVLPNILGLILGLCVPTYFMQKNDNSMHKQITQLEKENFEHNRYIERQLLQERVTRLKAREFEKILVKA